MGNPTYTKVKLTLSGSHHGVGEPIGQRDSWSIFFYYFKIDGVILSLVIFLDPLEGVVRYRCVLFFNNNKKGLFVIELANTFVAVVLFKSSHCEAGVLLFTRMLPGIEGSAFYTPDFA